MLLVYFVLSVCLLNIACVWLLNRLRLRGEWWTLPLHLFVVLYGAPLLALVLVAKTEADTTHLRCHAGAAAENSAAPEDAETMRLQFPLF